MQADKDEVSNALTVIGSNTSAATFLCSVCLTLGSLIGAWLGNSSNNIFRSTLIYGDTRQSTMSIKFICLLTCFFLAFSCFVQSARNFVHANYLITTPNCEVSVEAVKLAVIGGGDCWSLGLRSLYFALVFLLWFFGPIPMFVSSIIMVFILYYLDTNTKPLHPHRKLNTEKLSATISRRGLVARY
ncbi:receptor-like protein kinase HSL1-like [Hibiscus syriacus]|uniref:Receptor-like protein kinase HSL1-like n=1 Tax=Hibiscus syriacus TaxID=106335 RepID=A0A6A3BDP0_HIBSY|nr:receptor-like protein kinase HSL1-like [Hibiscus syriacus]